MHLRDEGPRNDPSPIVLIHGAGASLHTWEGWASALKSQRRVIRFDLPGFGLTGPFSGAYPPDDYRGDTLARFVLDLMDSLKLRRVVLGGNSLGGEVAWRVATLAPQRVERLVLVDAAGYAPPADTLSPGLRLARLPVVGWLSEHFMLRGVVEAGLRSVYADPRQVTPLLVDRHLELLLREGNRRALSLHLQQTVWGEGAERLATLRLPTLILWGRKDRLIPVANAQHFAKDIAGSQLMIFDELGHVPQEEDPARTVRALRDFIGLR